MRYFIFASLLSFVSFAKDIIPVNAQKFEKMPFTVVNTHNPDTISYNNELLNIKPQAQNVFEALEGNHSVEYQRNLQDMGGHTGVSINQLPFYYTSTFIDGIFVPDNFLDTAQVFSTASTEKISVNRGGANAGTNPSSLAGSVNIETLNARSDYKTFKLIAGNLGIVNSEFTQTKKIDEKSGLLFSVNGNYQKAIDENNDNIAESPRMQNFQTTMSHQFYEKDLKVKTRVDFSKNTKHGGSMVRNRENFQGNPFNWTNGGSTIANGWIDKDGKEVAYNGGTVGMMEVIDTQRISALSSVESNNFVGGGTLSLLQRDNFYMGNKYKADEVNLFFTGATKIVSRNTKTKIGGDFHKQSLSSDIDYLDGTHHTHNHGHDHAHGKSDDSYNYTAVSVFFNSNSSFEKFDTEMSLRGTAHSEFDFLGVARGKVNYHHNDNITSTIALGNSYFIPSSSFEQSHKMLEEPIGYFNRAITKPTEVLNFSYNASFAFSNLQVNLNYNFNEISNIATLELQNGDAVFRSLNGKYKVQGVGLDASYFFTPTLLWNVSAERYLHDLDSLERGFVILSRPNYKIFTSLTKKFDRHLVRLKATYFGKQDLEKFYGEVYNLAGIKNAQFSKEFALIDFDYSFKMNDKVQLLAGVGNLLNFVQISHSNQLATRKEAGHGHSHKHAHIDNVNSWGPVRGRLIYVGFKASI